MVWTSLISHPQLPFWEYLHCPVKNSYQSNVDLQTVISHKDKIIGQLHPPPHSRTLQTPVTPPPHQLSPLVTTYLTPLLLRQTQVTQNLNHQESHVQKVCTFPHSSLD